MNYKWFWNTFSSFGYSVLFSSFFPFISRDPISKIGILFPYAASLRKKSSEIKKGSCQDLLLLGGLYFKPFESNSVLGFLLQQGTGRLTKRNMNSAVTNLPIVFLWDFVQYLQWLPPWNGTLGWVKSNRTKFKFIFIEFFDYFSTFESFELQIFEPNEF